MKMASMNYNNPLDNSLEETNVFKTFKVLLDLPNLVLGWLVQQCSTKPTSKSYYDYLIEDVGWSNTKLKGSLLAHEVAKLKNNTELNSFDTSLHCKLLDKIISIKSDGNQNISNFLHYAKYIREVRNNTCHTVFSDLMRDFGTGEVLLQIKDVCSKMIRIVGEEFSVDKMELNIKLDFFQMEIDKVIRDSLIVKGDEAYIVNIFKEQLRLVYQQEYAQVNPYVYKSSVLDSVDIDDIYVELRVVKTKFLQAGTDIKCNDILNFFDQVVNNNKQTQLNSPFILLKGPAGAGKSTIVQKIISDWVSNRVIFNGLNRYEFLLYIECRNSRIKSLAQYFENLTPVLFNSSILDHKRLLNIIKRHKTLIVIDGLDELNHFSLELVREVFSVFATNDVLLTSRPESETNIISLKPDRKDLNLLELKGIPDHQWLEFISNHFNALCNQNIQSHKSPSDLVKRLLKCSDDLKTIIRLPLYLALVTYLYVTDDIVDFKLEIDLLKQLTQSNEEKVLKRLKSRDEFILATDFFLIKKIKAFKLRVEEVAFSTLIRKELNLNETICYDLIEFCSKENLPPDDLISTYLSYKKPDLSRLGMPIYSFSHKSFQENMAAAFIKANISNVLIKPLDQLEAKNILQHEALDIVNMGQFYNCMRMLTSVLSHVENSDVVFSSFGEQIVRIAFNNKQDISITDAYDFLKYSQFNNVLARFVSNHVENDMWEVNEDNINGALAVIDHVSPEALTLTIWKATDNIENFLEKVSLVNGCAIILHDECSYNSNNKPSSTDKYLKILLASTSCIIIGIKGYITKEFLAQIPADTLEILDLLILSHEDVESICQWRDIHQHKSVAIKLKIEESVSLTSLSKLNDKVNWAILVYDGREVSEDTQVSDLFSRISALYNPCTGGDQTVHIESGKLSIEGVKKLLIKLKEVNLIFFIFFESPEIMSSSQGFADTDELLELYTPSEEHVELCGNCSRGCVSLIHWQ